MEPNDLSGEIEKLVARVDAAQKAAKIGNVIAMREALSEAQERISALIKDIELDERGNEAKIQNTDV